MNLQQLEYIVAVDNHRNFAKAAKHCFVTQPTLSMMIKKLEEEFDLVIFDRSKQPVIPTEIGSMIITQARKVLQETKNITEILNERKKIIDGDFRIGIISTLAPYLIPLFINDFSKRYPRVILSFYDNITEVLLNMLTKGMIDVALLATPTNNPSVIEQSLFYEEFFVYSSQGFQNQYLLPGDINSNKLWLLEEGHCLRSQIINLCELRNKSNININFLTGSLEMLVQLVKKFQGITILPELATLYLPEEEKSKLNQFVAPAPVREISMVLHRNYVKKRHINALQEVILENLPLQMKAKKEFKKIQIDVGK